MRPSEGLARTEEILLEKGWTQGTPRNLEGNVCLAGALCLATGWTFGQSNSVDTGFNSGLYYALRQYVARQLALPDSDLIVSWNDLPARTFQEVLDTVHEAQLLAKADEQ